MRCWPAVLAFLVAPPALATSCIISDYVVEAGRVRFESNQDGMTVPVPQADAASLTLVPLPRDDGDRSCYGYAHDYARDRQRVYYRGQPIPGADPTTFTRIDWTYARDRNAIYGPSRRLTGRIAEFRTLPAGLGYATDGIRHFFRDETIDGDDFEELPYYYARTRDHVYRYGKLLPGRDSSTFQVRWPWVGITLDGDHVYQEDQEIPGADPATFEQVRGALFRDRRAVYLEGREVVGADRATVHLSRFGMYLLDDKSVFSRGKRLDRDLATFEELQPPYSKDRNGIYAGDHPLREADPDSFEAVSWGHGRDRNYLFHDGDILCKRHPGAPGAWRPCRPADF